MSFTFGAKPPATGATAGTTSGFPLGGASTGSTFSFGAPMTAPMTAPTAAAVGFAPQTTAGVGGFAFGSTPGGGLGAGTTTQATPAAPAAAGGFSFGSTPGLPAATQATTSGGFSFGAPSLGAASNTTPAMPMISLSKAPTNTTAPSTGFGLAGTPSNAGYPSGLAGVPSTGFGLAGTPSNAGYPSGLAGVPSTGFGLAGTPSNTGQPSGLAGAPSTGFGLAGASTIAGRPSGLAAAPTTGFGLAGATTIAGRPSGLAGAPTIAGMTTATSAAPSPLSSILKPTGTAALTTKTGVSLAIPVSKTSTSLAGSIATPGLPLSLPAKTTAGLGGTPATSGLSLGLGAKTLAPATTMAGTAATTASTGPKMKYQQLEQAINKWTVELEEQEKIFLKQATQVNAWDRLLIENGEKITSLHNDMEKVKADQQRLEHELDYIVAQQKELEDMLVPLEETVAAQQQGTIYTQHADLERERTYQLAENTDGQLKRMVQDLKDIIDHLNTANTPMDVNDPMNQIAKILNAHMDSLQWIDQNSVMLQRKVDEVAKQSDLVRRDQERNVHLAFD